MKKQCTYEVLPKGRGPKFSQVVLARIGEACIATQATVRVDFGGTLYVTVDHDKIEQFADLVKAEACSKGCCPRYHYVSPTVFDGMGTLVPIYDSDVDQVAGRMAPRAARITLGEGT